MASQSPTCFQASRSATTPSVATWLLATTGKGSSVAGFRRRAAALSGIALVLLAEAVKRDLVQALCIRPAI